MVRLQRSDRPGRQEAHLHLIKSYQNRTKSIDNSTSRRAQKTLADTLRFEQPTYTPFSIWGVYLYTGVELWGAERLTRYGTHNFSKGQILKEFTIKSWSHRM